MKPPGENAANSLWTEVLGPEAGEGNVGKSCGCCGWSLYARTLNNSTTCHPTYTNIRPKDSVHRESRAPTQGGVNRHLMLQPPKQPGPEFKFARGHGTRGRPQQQILWSDGWAWLANRVGVMSTPGRTDMLMKPTRVTHQALLSDQGLNIVVVFAHLGPLQAEALQQLASVGKTSRFWGFKASEREGFKGEWTEKALGAINTRNIEGRETQGV